MMPTLQGDKNVMLHNLLPEDPEDRQVVTMPEGQFVGGSNVINVERGGRLLGSIAQVAPVYTSSGKYEASRVASCAPIKPGDILRIRGWQHCYSSLIFIEGFGWTGYNPDTTKTVSLMDKHMRVIDAFRIGAYSSNCYLYEKVCLQLIREGETHEKPASNPSPTTSRDPKTVSSRPPATRRRSSSSSGTNTPSGSIPSKRPTIIDATDGTPEQDIAESDRRRE